MKKLSSLFPKLNYQPLMTDAARQYCARNYAMALAIYRRILVLRPNDTAALSGEAWSLYYMGQRERAARDFEVLLNLDANDSWAQKGIALCKACGEKMLSTPTTACA